jgi:hypothetical protein
MHWLLLLLVTFQDGHVVTFVHKYPDEYSCIREGSSVMDVTDWTINSPNLTDHDTAVQVKVEENCMPVKDS